ncbi:hypothetical protein BC830DRAFT_461618 [Chytriomyces sp. MP71]|nr:hypothetical protein BC830DRAFT_461618 [Chytriomyces sp. MP71]
MRLVILRDCPSGQVLSLSLWMAVVMTVVKADIQMAVHRIKRDSSYLQAFKKANPTGVVVLVRVHATVRHETNQMETLGSGGRGRAGESGGKVGLRGAESCFARRCRCEQYPGTIGMMARQYSIESVYK